jgi:hypothetical protein
MSFINEIRIFYGTLNGMLLIIDEPANYLEVIYDIYFKK